MDVIVIIWYHGFVVWVMEDKSKEIKSNCKCL